MDIIKVFVTFDFLLYISYKTTFFQKHILKLSLGRFYEIYFKTRRIL